MVGRRRLARDRPRPAGPGIEPVVGTVGAVLGARLTWGRAQHLPLGDILTFALTVWSRRPRLRLRSLRPRGGCYPRVRPRARAVVCAVERARLRDPPPSGSGWPSRPWRRPHQGHDPGRRLRGRHRLWPPEHRQQASSGADPAFFERPIQWATSSRWATSRARCSASGSVPAPSGPGRAEVIVPNGRAARRRWRTGRSRPPPPPGHPGRRGLRDRARGGAQDPGDGGAAAPDGPRGAPVVALFRGFGESALNFELQAWTDPLRAGGGDPERARSRRLRGPDRRRVTGFRSPQRDIHLTGGEGPQEGLTRPIGDRRLKAAAPGAPPRRSARLDRSSPRRQPAARRRGDVMKYGVFMFATD